MDVRIGVLPKRVGLDSRLPREGDLIAKQCERKKEPGRLAGLNWVTPDPYGSQYLATTGAGALNR
jgi:hypothetical protein